MNDLAFTQSMVDSLNLMVDERGIEVSITDNTFVPEEAAAAIDNYAAQGFDLIIAHGSQFGASLIDIAPRYPTTAFAWGTASDTFGLPNVYAYDAAAEEGGYVLGSIATMISSNKVTGVVGPIDVGDAAQYVRGFQAGAAAQDPASNVLVSFTGSFSDITLASEAAQAHIDAGAEVLTGSAQMVVGAISTADQQGVKWFGTQANQASLAPNSVVASQVYRWDVALRPILDDVAAGSLSGTKHTANLANGGLVIEFNPGVVVAPEVLQRANEVTNAIVSGQIDP
jgi:basic membrane protein A